jgi:hypothetical protein
VQEKYESVRQLLGHATQPPTFAYKSLHNFVDIPLTEPKQNKNKLIGRELNEFKYFV